MNFKEYHGYKVWDNGVVIGKDGLPRKTHLNPYGYYQVTLYFNGEKHTIKIHNLMGKLFLPNFKRLPTIEHKDQEKTNNSLFNLKWDTQRNQNINQGLRATNTSGVKGVSFHKKKDRWMARINPSSYKPIGKSFKTKEEAIAQRLAWEEEYYRK